MGQKPNIKKLKENRDSEGLIKAMSYEHVNELMPDLMAAIYELRISDERLTQPIETFINAKPYYIPGCIRAIGPVMREHPDRQIIFKLVRMLNSRNSYEKDMVDAAMDALVEIGDPAIEVLENVIEPGESSRWYDLCKEVIRRIKQ